MAKKLRLDERANVDDVSEETVAPIEPVGVHENPMKTEEPTQSGEPMKTYDLSDTQQKPDTSFKENPYTFLKPDDANILQCARNLSLNSKFPFDCILVRNPDGSAVRSMYFTTPMVRALIDENDYTRIRLSSAGTKVFAKQEGAQSKGDLAQFRILDEGLPALMPFIPPETILDGDLAVLKTLVTTYYPLCSSFPEPFRTVITERSTGSHVVKFALDSDTIHLPIWKSAVSVSLHVDKKAKSALSLRVFGEDITTAGRENIARKEKKAAGDAEDPGTEVDSPSVH